MRKHISPSPADGAVTVGLPVVWVETAGELAIGRVFGKFLRTVSALPEVVDLRLRACAGGTEPISAFLLVTGPDAPRALGIARMVEMTANASVPFLRFGAPVRTFESVAAGSLVSLHASPAEGETPAVWIAPWQAASQCTSRISFDLEILGVHGNDLRGDGHSLEATLRAEIRGSSAEASVVAALIAMAAGDDVLLETRHQESAVLRVPLSVAGRLACTPFHLVSLWQRRNTVLHAAAQMKDVLSEPRTAVAFSGQRASRTNLGVQLAKWAIDAGRAVCFMTRDPVAAASIASLLASAEHPFDVVDLGDRECPPPMGLCDPDNASVSEHVAELVALLDHSFPAAGEMDPSTRRAFRTSLSMMCSLPSALPFTAIEELLRAGPLPSEWMTILGHDPDSRDLQELHDLRDLISLRPELRQQLLGRVEHWLGDRRMRNAVSSVAAGLRFSKFLMGRSLVVSSPSENLGENGSVLVTSWMLSRLLPRLPQAQRSGGIDVMVDIDGLPSAVLERLLDQAECDRFSCLLLSRSPSGLTSDVLSMVTARAGIVATSRLSAHDAALIDGVYPTLDVSSRAQRFAENEWALTTGVTDFLARVEPPAIDPDVDLLRISNRLTIPTPSTDRCES